MPNTATNLIDAAKGPKVERPCDECGSTTKIPERFADGWPVRCDDCDGTAQAMKELHRESCSHDPTELIEKSGIYLTPEVEIPTPLDKFIENDRLGFYLYGAPDNGKSWMINELVRRWCTRRRTPALYVTEGAFLDALYDFDTRMNSIYRFKHVPLLVVDDLGSYKQSDWTGGTVGDVLDFRHYPRHKRKTVLVSNFHPDELKELKQFNDERTFRRITAIAKTATRVRHWKERTQ